MSTPYTSAEIWTKIRAIDIEIEDLRTKPLNYRIGSKQVNRDEQYRYLIENRKMLMRDLENLTDRIGEKHVVTDYEMDRFGVQLGDTLLGDD